MDRADFPLLYKKKHCLCINDITHSLYYYFDYDERSQKVNMEFQHSHPFYEIMVYLGPQQASHLIEGIPYSLCPGDFVFLRPSILHRSDYSNIQPSKRLIINFLYPPSLHLIEGIPYSLCPGDFVFLRPSILHRSDYSNIQPSKRLIINFLYPPSLWDNPAPYEKLFTPFHSMVPIYRFPVQKQITICEKKLNEIYHFSFRQEDSDLMTLMVHQKFLDFLYTFRELSQYNIYENSSYSTFCEQKIHQICHYIHTHYFEPLSLESLSRQFFISPCYLSHQFKNVTGYTLTRYIQMTRICNAQYMLQNTDKAISVLATECGFNSFSQFNRIFQNLCGQSPSSFRKNQSARITIPLF